MCTPIHHAKEDIHGFQKTLSKVYDLQKVQKLLQIESRTSTTITFTATASMRTATAITVLLLLLKVEPGWVVKC